MLSLADLLAFDDDVREEGEGVVKALLHRGCDRVDGGRVPCSATAGGQHGRIYKAHAMVEEEGGGGKGRSCQARGREGVAQDALVDFFGEGVDVHFGAALAEDDGIAVSHLTVRRGGTQNKTSHGAK